MAIYVSKKEREISFFFRFSRSQSRDRQTVAKALAAAFYSLKIKAVNHLLAFAAIQDKPGISEHREVPTDRRLGQPDRFDQFADG